MCKNDRKGTSYREGSTFQISVQLTSDGTDLVWVESLEASLCVSSGAALRELLRCEDVFRQVPHRRTGSCHFTSPL